MRQIDEDEAGFELAHSDQAQMESARSEVVQLLECLRMAWVVEGQKQVEICSRQEEIENLGRELDLVWCHSWVPNESLGHQGVVDFEPKDFEPDEKQG